MYSDVFMFVVIGVGLMLAAAAVKSGFQDTLHQKRVMGRYLNLHRQAVTRTN